VSYTAGCICSHFLAIQVSRTCCICRITVYLTEHGNINYPILNKVVEHASKSRANGSQNERCFLYKDEKGRLYNLTLDNGSSGLAGAWQSINTSFSGLQSLIALTVLSRVIPCFDDNGRLMMLP
jgi:hypothetical protein